jgi:hypothetical protein
MKKSIIINIETQTEDNDVVALCHVNEKVVALEISQIARIMFRRNRALFDKINNSTRLIGGALYRQEVLTPRENHNRLSTPILNSYEQVEREISQLFFENNVMRKQVRAISKLGRKFDFDPTTVSSENTGGNFDPKNLSPDDISESQIICEIEEIQLFQDQGVKTILITDTLDDIKSILEVGYRVEIVVDTEFRDYVDYVLRQSEYSLKFLATYSDSLYRSTNYDPSKQMFTEDFSDRIMRDLGLSTGMLNLSSNTVKNSEFGKAALSFYNLLSLMSPNVDASIYSKVLRSILPTNKTNPDLVNSFVSEFSSAFDIVRKEYLPNLNQTRKERNKYSRVSEIRTSKNTISATTSEKITLEQERLGYFLFSDTQKGLNKFSSADYKTRFAAEQAKYYPNVSIEGAEFLTPSEKSEFSRMDNAAAFLTPSSLILGQDRIKTNRGMKNLPINKVREFRLAKSNRAQQMKSTRNPVSSARAQVTKNVMSAFNITIAKPFASLLERTTDQEIDPLTDAKLYVGENSYFVTDNPQQLKTQFKRLMREEDRKILGIVSDIVPRRFLRDSKAIKSIKEIQFSNPHSKVRKLALAQELKIAEIPPHVKFMMSSAFTPNPNSDPMKNTESREIIEETQKNLFLVRALIGFEKDAHGFPDIRNPILKQIDMSDLSSGRPILAKASHYEIPELGIVKDKFAATIYNNLIYIRG